MRICLDNNFDENEIEKALKKYETDAKYKGLQEYEWNEVTTKEKEIEIRKAQARRQREDREREKDKRAYAREVEAKNAERALKK